MASGPRRSRGRPRRRPRPPARARSGSPPTTSTGRATRAGPPANSRSTRTRLSRTPPATPASRRRRGGTSLATATVAEGTAADGFSRAVAETRRGPTLAVTADRAPVTPRYYRFVEEDGRGERVEFPAGECDPADPDTIRDAGAVELHGPRAGLTSSGAISRPRGDAALPPAPVGASAAGGRFGRAHAASGRRRALRGLSARNSSSGARPPRRHRFSRTALARSSVRLELRVHATARWVANSVASGVTPSTGTDLRERSLEYYTNFTGNTGGRSTNGLEAPRPTALSPLTRPEVHAAPCRLRDVEPAGTGACERPERRGAEGRPIRRVRPSAAGRSSRATGCGRPRMNEQLPLVTHYVLIICYSPCFRSALAERRVTAIVL